MNDTNDTARPRYVVLHYAAPNDRNGNPRRAYVVHDLDTRAVSVHDEGYVGRQVVPAHVWNDCLDLGRVPTTVSAYRALLRVGA